jgi:hypothetical protein
MSKTTLNDPTQWIPRALFADYCGEQADKLLAYYDKAAQKRQMVATSFDWFAILLLPAWLGYRRQWTLWGTLTGMLAAISIAEALFRFHIPTSAFGGVMIALGMMAPGLLLSNAHGLYLRLKQQGLSHDAMRRALANRAAPSVGLACLALAGSLAVGIATALLGPSEYP